MTEKRRLNADFYGLITTTRDGFQAVANLVRGTEIGLGESGWTLQGWRGLVESEGREFKVDQGTFARLRAGSIKIDAR